MADIAVRSQQNIHGGGVGYKPTNTKPTARYTVTKSIQKTSDTLATVTMVITIKTNYEFVAVGLGETLTYQLFIDGVQRGSVVLKTASQTMNASGTYTRTLVARNVPLDHRTTQPANLRLVNDKRSDWEFNSNTQGGDQIVGLPIGIQRSNFSSFSGFTVIDGEVSFNATVTRVSSGTTHDVALLHGTTSIATWTGQGNFTSLSLTQAQSRVLLNRIKTSTTATVSLRVQTVHGGSVLYTQTRTATATVGITPSIGAVGISDSSGALTAVGALVQNVSNVTLSISSVVVGYGATLSSYEFEWMGQIHSGKTSSTLSTGIVNRSGNQTFSGRIRNSRGQQAVRSRTDTVLPWSTPRSTSVQVQRCTSTGTLDPAGSYMRVTGSHSVSPLTVGGVNKNTLRVLVRYRVAGTTTWTNALNKTYPAGTVSTNEAHTLGGGALDPTKTYDFEVIAYDRYANTVVTGQIPTERVLISKVRNDGVGFGKIWERGIIDAKGDVYIDGDLHVEGGVDLSPSTTPSTSKNFVTGDDLNDFTTPGFYHTHMNAVATTLLNAPTASAFSMIVSRNAGVTQHVVQYPAATPRMWVRNMYNNIWGEWKLIPYTSDLNGFPVLEVGSSYVRTPSAGLLPYSADTSSGQGVIGSRYQPFSEVNALNVATNSLRVLAPNGSEIIMLAADQPSSTTGKVWIAFGDSERVSGINLRTAPDAFFAPTLDDNVYLGLYSQRWKAVYAVNGTIVTSGREHKEDILPATDVMDELLDVASRSIVTYKYKGTEGMLGEHLGLIADDLKDLEGFKYIGTEEKQKDGSVEYGLKPLAVASLALHGYHKQKERISDLEERISNLEKAIEKHCAEAHE